MARKLLLIEDDDTTRELLTLLLAAEDWDVEAAATGEEALALLPATNPEVILSDLHLPGLCGTPLADALRKTCTATLIAMTATATAGTPEGYDALLVKPFAPAAVQQACDNVQTETQTGAPTENILDEAIFTRMSSSMPAAQLAALYQFALDDAESRLKRMQTAEDATFRSEAHALKGSAGMIGAVQLRALASAAEQEGASEDTLRHLAAATANFRHMLKTRMPQ